MVKKIPQQVCISAGETELAAVNYADWLDSGELLTGTPTVTEQVTSDLTIGSVAVNTGALTILGESVSTGQAVQFTVSGQQANSVYTVRVTASTDATPARTSVRDWDIVCVP